MTKQDVAVELFYDGAWHDLVTDDTVFTKPTITLTHGGGAEGAAQKPNTGAFQLDNADDRYRPSNPLSELYGRAGRNTPCRISVGGTVRVIGEASFESDQDESFRQHPRRGRRWVDVDVAGVSQRIGQWTEPLRSAFRFFNDQIAGVSGYWPMEDDRGATVARSAIDGSQNIFLQGQSFGSQNSPPGGGPGIDITSDHSLAQFIFEPGNPASTAGWEYSIATYLGDMDSAGTGYPAVFLGTQNGITIILDITATPLSGDPFVTLNIVSNTSTLFNSNFTTGDYQFSGRWILWRAVCTVAAGTVTVGVSWRGVDDPTWVGVSGTYSGTVTSDLYFSAPSSMPDRSTYAHVIGTRGRPGLDSDDRFDAFLGHPGERAAYRFGRLCGENNIPYFVSNSFDLSMPMGPQRVDTLPGHFKEIAATDDAMIFDDTPTLDLFMLCGADRMNQAPTLTLNALADDELAVVPAETLNDLDPHNIVTASQREGGDFTRTDDTSPMGTQPPPDGVGEYKQTVDVNVDDEAAMLPQVAGWWLGKGTIDRPRFQTVSVNLVASPHLIDAVEDTEVGSVIEIINLREYTIRLHVLGFKEVIGTHSRTVVFTCELDNAYDVGTLDSDRRLPAGATTLNAAIGANDTTLVLKMTSAFEAWRPGSNQVPVMIGGELVTLGTVGAVTGSGPWTQTVTGCTRAVNGIVKPQKAGESVQVDKPVRMALMGA